MYFVYKDEIKIAETEDKVLKIEGLSEGTHLFGISQFINGIEGIREFVTVNVMLPVEASNNTNEELVNDYHTKAGWYKFPDGYKVRGKEAAEEYLEKLNSLL